MSIVSRRYALLSAFLVSRLTRPAVASRNDYIDLLERIGSRPGLHTPVIMDAFREARSRRMPVIARAGVYRLDEDLDIDWSNFILHGEGERTLFVQVSPRKGFLRLSGHNNEVRGISFTCSYERRRLAGRWRGYGAFQRVCAVWAEGGGNLIEAVAGENSFGVVCLRGPVIPLRPSVRADAGTEAFDYTAQAAGNIVRNISGRYTDFVLTGNQQKDLLIDGVTARNTTALSVPPHAIYMQNPGSRRAFCGFSSHVRARRLDSRDNPHAEAFRFSDIRGLTIEDPTAHDTAGGLTVSTSDGVLIRGGRWTARDWGAPIGLAAVRVSQSVRVRMEGGHVAQPSSGVLVYNGSENIDVREVSVEDRIEEGAPASPFRVQDTSEACFTSCLRTRYGADRPMFVVANKAVTTIEAPECRRSSWLVDCGPEATARLSVDPVRVDGWDMGKRAFSGAIDRIDRSGLAWERRRSRPLPGSAGDNTCTALSP